jgi:hypothetical protein
LYQILGEFSAVSDPHEITVNRDLMGEFARRPLSESPVRAALIIFHPPLLDHDLRLLQRIEDFSIQAFIPQLAVETFTVAVFPGASRLDVQSSSTQTG